MVYTYSYPRPMVTVDIVVFRTNLGKGTVELLLIERAGEPYARFWALPGGFIEMEETLQTAAERELAEETGITGLPLAFLEMADEPNRDPRGRTISAIFTAFAGPEILVKSGSDARNSGWFSPDSLPNLAFDHQTVVEGVLEQVRSRLLTDAWILEILPEYFELTDLQKALQLWNLNGALARTVVERLLECGMVKTQSEGKYQRWYPSSLLNLPASNRLKLFLGRPLNQAAQK
ncbi:MAG: hypothetical protein Kow0037_25890 [Calditrichia bacterium]